MTEIYAAVERAERNAGILNRCSDPVCEREILPHNEYRCVVTNDPFCDICIEFHRENCMWCYLNLQEKQLDFKMSFSKQEGK